MRTLALAGLVLLIALMTPVPVQSGKPPCPQSIVSSNSLLSFMIPAVGACPPSFWAKTYGAKGSDIGNSVGLTSDGGFIIAGSTDSFGAGGTDAWVLRLDGDGNVLWQRTYGTVNNDSANAVRQTSDGRFIVVGSTCVFVGCGDFWALRLDGSGNIVWQKAYTLANNENETAVSVDSTVDGGFVIAGQFAALGNPNNHIIVFRLDSFGNMVWLNTYGGAGKDYVYDMRQTSDGGIVLSGGTTSFGAGGSDSWVLRLDGNGSILWQKTFGSLGGDGGAHSVGLTSNGGFIVAGDSAVLRLDGSGNVLWQKTYAGYGALAIQQTSDGGFAAATTAFDDFWVLRLDGSGNVVWQKTYGITGATDHVEEMQVTPDGGVIVVGYTLGGSYATSDSFVLRLDPNGNIPNCNLMKTTKAASSNSTLLTTDSTAVTTGTGAVITTTKVAPSNGAAKASRKCG